MEAAPTFSNFRQPKFSGQDFFFYCLFKLQSLSHWWSCDERLCKWSFQGYWKAEFGLLLFSPRSLQTESWVSVEVVLAPWAALWSRSSTESRGSSFSAVDLRFPQRWARGDLGTIRGLGLWPQSCHRLLSQGRIYTCVWRDGGLDERVWQSRREVTGLIAGGSRRRKVSFNGLSGEGHCESVEMLTPAVHAW